jgi:hypothetical protein
MIKYSVGISSYLVYEFDVSDFCFKLFLNP